MLACSVKWLISQRLFQILSVIAAIVFGSLAAGAVYTVIKDEEVFMTSIHGIFLNPWFMTAGAYLGLYAIYCLMAGMRKQI